MKEDGEKPESESDENPEAKKIANGSERTIDAEVTSKVKNKN
jgi:hypothetical protein